MPALVRTGAAADTPGIRVDGMWKKFKRGHVHDSLRDLIPALARRAVGRGPKGDELTEKEFWALSDVSFDVAPGEVFVVSDMTIEVREQLGGPLITFNGTTEWALDSIPASKVLWLPREDQLRAALGDRFSRLESLPDGFVVVLADGRRAADIDAERAYARAVLLTLG